MISSYIMSFYLKIPSYEAFFLQGVSKQKLQVHLGSFGVTENLALQPMCILSGGQKGRDAFAKITFKKPHVVMLDQPSNHLGLDVVEVLIQGLVLFQGGILMASHDEHLIYASGGSSRQGGAFPWGF
ncbi:ABC transporter F family member 3-like [Eucalyptus grandis]|uniref:ABC transporter F family member 3-like n=1 Tax=Eucalyptus grandis TaxID=71139 RepID=UPI00192EB2C7|nr:ABC transporter F family member 3-like [Eucalyptus grandis]